MHNIFSESWLARYFYTPSLYQKIFALIIFPLSLLYCLGATLYRKQRSCVSFSVPIISIGNITIGGSGKTPLIIELAKYYPHSAIVLRGYGRKSRGLYVVSHQGKKQCTVQTSGDEAMLLADKLQESTVIVSENRLLGIQKAIELGCVCVFLDDGFRHPCVKYDILLMPSMDPFFPFCLPSGIYRESPRAYLDADLILQEGEDFDRLVEIVNPTAKMILVTAIANPKRLNAFLPNSVVEIHTYPDHYYFKEHSLQKLLKTSHANSILTTEKDAVKMKSFDIPLSVMTLTLNIKADVLSVIHANIQKHGSKN
jgi:tetraacyldisaccharide 4'-kinase